MKGGPAGSGAKSLVWMELLGVWLLLVGLVVGSWDGLRGEVFVVVLILSGGEDGALVALPCSADVLGRAACMSCDDV